MCTMVIKNLATVSLEEQIEFVNSFDQILSDMDGVIWLVYKALPGVADCLKSLDKLGKKVHLVTNNTLITVDNLWAEAQKNKLETLQCDDIINPHSTVISYLRRIGFEKELFVCGTEVYKDVLRKAGFKLTSDPPLQIEETAAVLFKNIEDDENVGGVLFDVDLNLTFLKLQKVLTYLKRKDCIFIIGAEDKVAPIGKNGPIIGPYYFQQALMEISGREPVRVSKPSAAYNDCLVEKFNITDPKRVLFIGDSIKDDMRMGTIGGYQKLLVLSGIANMEDINNWQYPEECKPDYYVESLDVLNNILKLIK